MTSSPPTRALKSAFAAATTRTIPQHYTRRSSRSPRRGPRRSAWTRTGRISWSTARGQHLLILNKTAWAYFGCQDPGGYLDRARSQGVNVIRVALEGRPYWNELNLELVALGRHPRAARLEPVQRKLLAARRRAGAPGGRERHWLGRGALLRHCIPDAKDIATQQSYWEQILRRLGKYANILTWEIANEYTRNETFQDAAGRFFQERDPHHRPVCSSDGTTDDAVWPAKPWMDLAINHTCTSSTPRHDLRDWYLAVARNTRAHGKPAWCNESGRERRHQNDDGVHRRKQGWLWYAAGCLWTWHSWDGCEGINDRAYRAPGEEFLRPMVADVSCAAVLADEPQPDRGGGQRRRPWFRPLWPPPNATACSSIAARGRLAGASPAPSMTLRLPDGIYRISVLKPADGATVETRDWASKGLGQNGTFALPPFTDDLAVRIERTHAAARTAVPGTQ